jgi:hypothetical protein
MPEPGAAKPMKKQTSDGTLPEGPRWITVLRRWDDPEEVPSTPEGLSVLGDVRNVEVLSVYEVTGGEKYKFATFESGDTASSGGSERPDVLLPLRGGGELFARLSMLPPTKTRLRQQVHCLNRTLDNAAAETPGHSFLPLYLGQLLSENGPDQFKQAKVPSGSSSAGSSGEASGERDSVPVATVYLPNPLAAAQHRLDRAREARDILQEWEETAQGTAELTGLVGDTCFAENHGRTYLQEALKADPEALPWTEAEETFLSRPGLRLEQAEEETFGGALADSPVAEWGRHDGVLGQVLYGLRCQRVFLRKQRDRAVGAVRAVLQSAPTQDLIYDAKGHPESDPAATVAKQIVGQYAQLSAVGDGGYLTALIHDCLKEYSTVQEALDALGGGEDKTKKDKQSTSNDLLVEDPRFKALFATARLTNKGLDQIVAGSVPAALAAPAQLAAGDNPQITTKASMPAPLAFLGGLLARPDQGGATIPEGSSVVKGGPGGPISFTKATVDGLEHRGPDVGQRWRIDRQTTLSSTFAEAARDVGLTPKRVQGAAGVLDALNVVIAGTTLMWNFKQGTLKPESGLEAAKFLSDSAGMAERAAEAGKKTDDLPAGVKGSMKVLAKLGPYLDAVTIAWNVAEALSHDREEGLQKVDDPHYVGALGAMASGTGGLVLTGAFGTLGAPVLAGAGALTLLGAGLGWYEQWRNVEEHIESDPLGRKAKQGIKLENYDPRKHSRSDLRRHSDKEWVGWLPEQSQWGKKYSGDPAAREALKKLATPKKKHTVGSSKSSEKSTRPRKGSSAHPPIESIKDETEQFVQKAFTFPTAVGVPPKPSWKQDDWTRPGPPKRLLLSIIPKYVPKDRGTFMIDATLTNPATGDATSLDCVVHHVNTSEGVHYCVLPAEEDLTLPKEKPLKKIALDQKWARAQNEETPLPGGGTDTKIHLPVHVGPWPCNWYTEGRRETAARNAQITENLEPENWSPAYRKRKESFYQSLIKKKAAGSMTERSVAPKSLLVPSDPTQLDKILQSGRFQVTGTVYFRPLRPFDPNPAMPEDDDRLLSRYQFEYGYPRDRRD